MRMLKGFRSGSWSEKRLHNTLFQDRNCNQDGDTVVKFRANGVLSFYSDLINRSSIDVFLLTYVKGLRSGKSRDSFSSGSGSDFGEFSKPQTGLAYFQKEVNLHWSLRICETKPVQSKAVCDS